MLHKLSLLALLALLNVTAAVPAPQVSLPLADAPSSTSASGESSAPSASSSPAPVSSVVPSATSSASAAAPSASSSVNQTYLDGFLEALVDRNAPLLASVLQNNTDIADALYAVLSTGKNYTLIAPTDQGLETALATLNTTNTTLLAELLEYHLIPGYYPADSLGVNVTTIVETSIGEALVFYRNQYLTTHVVGGQNVTILANATYENVLIKLGDNALTLPVNISATLQETDSTLLTALSSYLPDLVNALDTTPMLTVFAPSNDAIAAITSQLASLATNTTALQEVIDGHVVNGTVIYSNTGSPDIVSGGSITSAAGTNIQFISNTTGLYVSSRGTTAQIIESNIITSNGPGMPGVIHVIDGVLIPPVNQTSAASGASSSASGSASAASATPVSSASASASGAPLGASASQSVSAGPV